MTQTIQLTPPDVVMPIHSTQVVGSVPLSDALQLSVQKQLDERV
jgi:hypothetical protein